LDSNHWLPTRERTPSGINSGDDFKTLLRATIESAAATYLEQFRDESLPGAVRQWVRRGRDQGREDVTRELGRIFHPKWFTNRLFFLFRKNLRVTNIQFAELLALMRAHVDTDVKAPDGSVDIHRLQFLGIDDFEKLFNGLLEDVSGISRGEKPNSDELDAAVEQLAPLLKRTILLDRFHGSCIAFLPAFMWLDLERVCGESGYVHSCGHVIYVRNIEKTADVELKHSLREYLEQLPQTGESRLPIRLNLYTHEDHDEADALYERDQRHGLDSVKIHLDKFHVGNRPLTALLPDLEREFPDELLVVGPPGQTDPLREFDPSHSFWLISEKSIAAANAGFGKAVRYLICYDQWWKNRNPLHVLDEEKPAWLAPVTIPHALLGAMLNITRPWRRGPDDTVSIADPFAGTGSTLLESLKFTPDHVVCAVGDLDEMSTILADDNANILGASSLDLEAWITLLAQIVVGPDGSTKFSDDERSRMQEVTAALGRRIDAAFELSRSVEIGSEAGVPPSVAKELRARSREDRFIFYLMLKTRTKHLTSLVRGTAVWGPSLSREAEKLKHKLDSLRSLRLAIEAEDEGASSGLIRFADKWSIASTFVIDPGRVAGRMEHRSVRDLPARTYDVIVADPPYGYNTDVGTRELAALYRDAFGQMLRALKGEGQLVLAIPDQSFSGRTTPTFAHKEFCIRLLLALAEEERRQVYSIADAFPSERRIFLPPYYWESERALRRAILHFRIRDRPFDGSRTPLAAGS
jgi:hypothetical protein